MALSNDVDGVLVLACAHGVEPIMYRQVGGERASDGVAKNCVGAVRSEVSGGAVAASCHGMGRFGSEQLVK